MNMIRDVLIRDEGASTIHLIGNQSEDFGLSEKKKFVDFTGNLTRNHHNQQTDHLS